MTAQSNPGPLARRSLAIRDQISARLHSGKLDYDRDMHTLSHEVEVMAQMNETFVVGRLFTLMGAIEFERGHYIAVYDYFQVALTCYQQVGDEQRIISSLSNLGEVHRKWGKCDEALKYFGQAREMAEKMGDWGLLALILSNLGLFYLENGQAEQALPFFRSALEQAPRGGTPFASHSETYGGIARANLALGGYNEALEAAQLSLQFGKESNRAFHIASAYRTLAILASHMGEKAGDPDSYFQQSKELFRIQGAQAEYARTLMAEARWMSETGHATNSHANLVKAHNIFNDLKLPDEADEARRMMLVQIKAARVASV